MLAIEGATLHTPERRFEGYRVLLEGQRIAAVAPADERRRPTQARVLDGRGLFLVPGLIDLQVNGAFGRDFTSEPDAIYDVAAGLPRFGVTAFLPTIVSSPSENIVEAQRVLRAGPPAGFRGALPLGLHLEGPFLNPEKAGAHDPAFLCAPDLDLCGSWAPDLGVRLVTLAPELPGALPLIRALRDRGVVIGAGHTLATGEQARAAIEAGLSYGTHLFNAMPPLHHRRPGLVPVLLAAPHVTVGLIADGEHVHAEMLLLVWRAAGPGRISLVSDAMAGLGMPDGDYPLGPGRTAAVQGGRARLVDGTLAGSAKPQLDGLRNMIEAAGCSLHEALRTVTSSPAAVLGMQAHRGQIVAGAAADLVLLTPDLEVAATIVGGELIYQR